jgi:hypothetical protein
VPKNNIPLRLRKVNKPLNFLAYSRKVNCIKFQFQKGLNDGKPQAKNIHSSKPCFEFTNLFFSQEMCKHKENDWQLGPMRPKARGLTQHGGPPGWLEESDQAGVTL